MFGLSIARTKSIQALEEANRLYSRALEDVGWLSLNSESDQKSGILSGQEFKNMIRRCRLYYNKNPLAGHWVNLTNYFVFGEGVAAPKIKDEKAQEAINNFWNDKDNKMSLTGFLAQQKLGAKLQYEGNLFFALFKDEAGNVKTRVINTDEIEDIIKDPDDRMRPIFYKARRSNRKYNFNSDTYDFNLSSYVYYPDKDNANPTDYNVPQQKLNTDFAIFHIKINCDLNDKFGVPDLYRSIDWMKAHKDMAGDLATLIKSLSKIAWKKKIKGTPRQVSALKTIYHAKTDLSNVGPAAGSTQIENQNLDLSAVNTPTGGVKIGKDGLRQMLLMVCAGSGIFEHYFGNPETGNLATTTSMELPMIKKFVYYQQIWTDIYKDIITFMLDAKVSLGLLPGKSRYDSNSNRDIHEHNFDDTIDHDFPPIIQKVLKEVAEALQIATSNNLCSQETAASIFLLAAGQNNIDQELEKIKQQQVAPEIKPKKDDKKEEEKADTIKEAIDTPDKKKAARLAKKSNYVLQRMNGYRNLLNSHYKAFREGILKSSKSSGSEGQVVGNITSVSGTLNKLSSGMKSAADKFFPEAIKIGTDFLKSHLKDKDVKENITEAAKKEKNLLQKKLDWNSKYIDESLIPDIEAGLTGVIRQSYETEEKFLEAVKSRMSAYEARIEQYVGAFWTVEEAAVKEAGKGTGLSAKFVGADDEQTCEGCSDALAGNPYSIDNIPEPGTLDCLNRCRHAIQIEE